MHTDAGVAVSKGLNGAIRTGPAAAATGQRSGAKLGTWTVRGLNLKGDIDAAVDIGLGLRPKRRGVSSEVSRPWLSKPRASITDLINYILWVFILNSRNNSGPDRIA